jgi:O-acetyl-ADP-ribose deacetylase (regulator of RNase III)
MIQVVLGVLAEQRVDGLMRPARSDLAPVSTVSRDLVVAAGEELQQRIERMGVLPVGGAVLTPAGLLSAGFLIHAVVMSEEEPQTSLSVQRALRNGLRRAADWELASLALPPFGLATGAGDPEDAARALVENLFNHLDEGVAPLDLRIVVSSQFESDLFGRLVDEATRARSASRN